MDDRIGSAEGLFGGTALPLIRSRTALAMLALATVVVIGYIDNITGTQLSVGAIYLVPVAAAAWYVGFTPGRITALAAFAAKIGADLYDVNAPALPVVVWNALMILLLALAAVEILARLHQSLEGERALARTDALTGLANARSFDERATIELERMQRYGRPFTVACLDLDHFKSVNDTLGHAGGDRLLADVGGALRHKLRRVDVVARLGGDEFILLLPETSAAPALYALEHVRKALAQVGVAYGPDVRASIGAVTYSVAPASVSEMLRDADLAMYRAKSRGRDRVESVTLPEEASLLDQEIDVAPRAATAGCGPVEALLVPAEPAPE